ncbi:MAG: guanylate kinase, partial [Alphaproteobacteria bacterium]|nr:guanylate kinase [Alphaproteobacteria bacterium]
MTEIKRRGLMLVLSSPSGAGKSTLARGLLASDGGIFMSISATTRSPRPNEVEGRDYFFVTPDRFESMASGGELYEHAHVFDHRYGTPKKPVRDALESGRDVL